MWDSLGVSGSQWESVGLGGTRWHSMGVNGCQWDSVDKLDLPYIKVHFGMEIIFGILENVEILKVSENACFFVLAYWCRSVWGRGIFLYEKNTLGWSRNNPCNS